jgi:hypothetical protein
MFQLTLPATKFLGQSYILRNFCAPLLIIQTYLCHNQQEQFYSTFFSQASLHIQTKLLDITSAEYDMMYQLLITYSAFIKYLRRHGDTIKQYINSVLASRKPMKQSEETLCIIFSCFGVTMKAVQLIKMFK